jgi:hypothetical protein
MVVSSFLFLGWPWLVFVLEYRVFSLLWVFVFLKSVLKRIWSWYIIFTFLFWMLPNPWTLHRKQIREDSEADQQGTSLSKEWHCVQFPSFTFCFIHPRFGAKKAGNRIVNRHRQKPFSSLKGQEKYNIIKPKTFKTVTALD